MAVGVFVVVLVVVVVVVVVVLVTLLSFGFVSCFFVGLLALRKICCCCCYDCNRKCGCSCDLFAAIACVILMHL